MSQHTPGPWKVEDGIFVVGPDRVSIFGGASTKRSDDVCEANARLIAAAPEMFEYLCNLARVWAMSQGENATLDILRALLAKVEGVSL